MTSDALSPQPPLSPVWRARLVFAVLVLTLFALGALIHGVTVTHDWFETQDSLEHWRAWEQAAQRGEAYPGHESPRARIQRLEDHAEGCLERLALSVGMLLFFGALAYLGVRAYRAQRP